MVKLEVFASWQRHASRDSAWRQLGMGSVTVMGTDMGTSTGTSTCSAAQTGHEFVAADGTVTGYVTATPECLS